MQPLIRYVIKQAVFINVIFVLLIVCGIYSLVTIPVEQYPPVEFGKIVINDIYYGASAEDVESLVTDKIEDALDGMENIEYISSTSMRNKASLLIKLVDDTDYRALYDEIRFRVLNVRNDLPERADEPIFMFLQSQDWLPVMVVNLVGDIPNASLKLLGDELKARFENVPGVKSVIIAGDNLKEFHVSLDPARLRRYGITFDQTAAAVASANIKVPTGRFRNGEGEFVLEAGGRFSSQEAILDVVVRRDGDGNFIRIRDLATSARLSHRDPETISSVNGETALQVILTKEDSSNTIRIAAMARKIVDEFSALHQRDGVKVVVTQDSTVEIKDSLVTLGGNLLLGMILVTLVLWVTLGFRTALLTAIGIPFSFLCGLIIMQLSAMSINVITLIAAILVSGIIVDDAIVITENVDRHRAMGKSMHRAVVDGTAEIFLPVTSSALTTIIAFIPMMMMTGSTGEFFSMIPKSVTIMLIASLLEALFILPVHILDIGPKNPDQEPLPEEGDSHGGASNEQHPEQQASPATFAFAWRFYHRFLGLLLDNKGKTLFVVFGLFVVAISMLALSVLGIAPLIKVKFFPGNFAKYHVGIRMPAGTAIEATDTVVKELSSYLAAMGGGMTESAEGTAGMYENEDYIRSYNHNLGQVVVTLPDREARDFPDNPENNPLLFLDYVRKTLRQHVSEQYQGGLAPRINIFEEGDGPPVGKPVSIRVSATSLQAAQGVVDQIMTYLRTSPECADLIELADNRPSRSSFAVYTPKLEAAAEYGLEPGQVATMISSALLGRYAGQFRTPDEEVDLMVRLARADDPGNGKGLGLKDPEALLEVPIVEDSEAPVTLGDVADLRYNKEADMLNRYNGYPSISITADIKADSQLSPSRVQNLVTRFLTTSAPPPNGVTVSFAGEFQDTQRAYSSLAFAFIAAILGIYLILASQFRDYWQPIIIMSAIVFSLIGVVFGMSFTASTFTVRSFIAVVGLAGVVVNDSLILVDFFNVQRRNGVPLREAIIQGCNARMRPVLITTITTTLGMLPMAIGIPEKSLTWAPMATTFVTGLTTSTLLALLVVPVQYELLEKFRQYRQQRNT